MNLSASSAKPGDPTYFLEGIIHDKSEMADFEGPLSLILLLLSKNKIEIRDIKISDILDQYLEYLNAMEKLDLEIASEFVQMASYLLYIKTRMLLTRRRKSRSSNNSSPRSSSSSARIRMRRSRPSRRCSRPRRRPGCTICRARRSRCRRRRGSTAIASRRPIFCARCCPCSRAAAQRRRIRCSCSAQAHHLQCAR